MTNLLPISSTLIHAKLSMRLEGAEEEKTPGAIVLCKQKFLSIH